MINCLVVGIGGFIGAVLRYLFGLIPIKQSGVFPLNTLAVNIIGAFVIGIITAAALKFSVLNDKLLLFLKVGICGGFTTFSTFSLESLQLFQNGRITVGILYVVISVLGCIAAVYAAQSLFKIIA